MAIYHLSFKFVSRGQGRSAVSASAYRAGEKLHNEYDGLTHNFTKKRGISHTEIILPENAPIEFSDRSTFWNAVEKSEKRADSRTAREIEIALPRELNLDEQIQLVREFIGENITSRGLCADVAIHSGHKHKNDLENPESEHDKIIHRHNPHVHILFSDRPVNCEGFCAKKDRDLNQKKTLLLLRERWANIQNREFEKRGLEVRVSHESHATRGIENEPTIHLGHTAHELEKRGIKTERGNKNREIKERNKAREQSRNRGISAVEKHKSQLNKLQEQERRAYKIPDRKEREKELLRLRDERVKLHEKRQQELSKNRNPSREYERER
jgi:hypothetical protein